MVLVRKNRQVYVPVMQTVANLLDPLARNPVLLCQLVRALIRHQDLRNLVIGQAAPVRLRPVIQLLLLSLTRRPLILLVYGPAVVTPLALVPPVARSIQPEPGLNNKRLKLPALSAVHYVAVKN